MSTAKKLDSKPEEKVAEKPQENIADILEFSITKQIKGVDLSALGGSSEDEGPGLVGENTSTQIIELAKSNNEVDVLEAQVKLIALFVSESRILESEINKYIGAIHKQSPQSKKYLLHIKKLLKDFTNIEETLKKAKSVK